MGTIYLSHAQYANNRNWTMTYVVRTVGSATASVARIRSELAGIDNALVLYRLRTMDDVLGGHRARARFTLLLMTVFSAIALSLAAIGVYGVLSYTVSQRAQEMGIRLALGARAGQVRGIVVRRAAFVAGIGLVVGLVGAWLLSRFLESLVLGVSVRDPLVFTGVALLLGLVVLAAAWLPARRATRLSPLDALRT
jgi:ABC-type antimicrobial peptide transport system permease subunit